MLYMILQRCLRSLFSMRLTPRDKAQPFELHHDFRLPAKIHNPQSRRQRKRIMASKRRVVALHSASTALLLARIGVNGSLGTGLPCELFGRYSLSRLRSHDLCRSCLERRVHARLRDKSCRSMRCGWDCCPSSVPYDGTVLAQAKSQSHTPFQGLGVERAELYFLCVVQSLSILFFLIN
jgi:hypothetical protein